MSTSPSAPRRLGLVLAIACSSAAALIFEIALTRVFAVTQFYHFAFMAVSLALLGSGASGSILAISPALAQPRRWAVFASAQSLATLGAYLLSNALPFDSYSIAWDTRQMVYLALSYAALGTPFFFAGLVTGSVLSSGQDGHRDALLRIRSHHAYAANLIGSGAGCLLALAGLSWWGGVGVIVFAALVAMLAALGFQLTADRRSISSTATTLGAIALFTFWIFQPPDWFELRLSPYKDLSEIGRASCRERGEIS